MSKLSEIAPTSSPRIMDLVEAAGVNVSDWGNFKGGKKNAARNPKYCFEWSFVEPKKVVVLNLWHHKMEEKDGVIRMITNMRESALRCSSSERGQSLKMDAAIQTALREKLPIRVVVLSEGASSVYRLLDPMPWAVTKYDSQNGGCTLQREEDHFVDQFTIGEESVQAPER